MALQWMILTYVVAAEAAVAILLTLPSPKAIKSRIVSLISLTLQPSLFIVPFAGFQLLGTYTLYSFSFIFSKWILSVICLLSLDLGFWTFSFYFFVWCISFVRYILEKWASVDVHGGDLHCCREKPLREIRNFSLSFLFFSVKLSNPFLLTCTGCLYI